MSKRTLILILSPTALADSVRFSSGHVLRMLIPGIAALFLKVKEVFIKARINQNLVINRGGIYER